MTYTQTWDEVNRLKTVTVNGQTTTYVYDGDGQRVKRVQGGQTTVYIGNYYEKNLSTGGVTTYYYANGQRIAMRQGSTVYYFTGDHLGSTSLTTTSAGSEVGRQKYYPYGTLRSLTGWLYTDYKFTGQREESNLGALYDYNARFYSPYNHPAIACRPFAVSASSGGAAACVPDVPHAAESAQPAHAVVQSVRKAAR